MRGDLMTLAIRILEIAWVCTAVDAANWQYQIQCQDLVAAQANLQLFPLTKNVLKNYVEPYPM
jgi:hypothetical protein